MESLVNERMIKEVSMVRLMEDCQFKYDKELYLFHKQLMEKFEDSIKLTLQLNYPHIKFEDLGLN